MGTTALACTLLLPAESAGQGLVSAFAQHGMAAVLVNSAAGLPAGEEPDGPLFVLGLLPGATAAELAADARLREALSARGLTYQVLYGDADACARQALRALQQRQVPQATAATRDGAHTWFCICGRCGDPDAERRDFQGLLQGLHQRRGDPGKP